MKKRLKKAELKLLEQKEEIENMAFKNRNMAKTFEALGYKQEQISSIAFGSLKIVKEQQGVKS